MKSQGYTEVIQNVHMLSHGIKPKFGMPISKSKDDLAQTQIHDENIIEILRPKVKVKNMSGMSVTHCPMVIHSFAKYGMAMSKKETVARTQSHIKNHMNLILE